MLVETLSFSSSSQKAWSHPWLSSSQRPPRPMYQLIQPTLPPKYDPSSPIPHVSATWLQKPGYYFLPAHPLFRLISFQQPEGLFLSLSDLYRHSLAQTIPHPTSPISQSKSWRPWCTQDSPSSVSMHAPVLSHHILTAHPCSLHFLSVLVSRTCHKHSHLRDFVFCVFSACSLHPQMSLWAGPLPNSSFGGVFFYSNITFLYYMFSL